MRKKHILQIASIVMIIVLVLVITYLPKQANSQQNSSSVTVFVHGYKGTVNSFGGMLGRFERNDWGNKALIYHVSNTGDVNVYNLNKGKLEPVFIQVIFENNRASFEDTATWLSLVMHHLKETYQIDSVNLVGHSMGGLVSLKYVEEYQEKNLYPVTNKLITIGSPFDGIYSQHYFQLNHDAAANDLKPNSSALQRIQSNSQSIPKDLAVFSIGSTGDLVAVPESVQELRMMIPADQLTEVMIENDHLGHSELHENEQVDELIHSFLWQEQAQ
ncbi:alpha/beta fold hydrolase [Lentibacillus sp. Marseille-P4043]|uniref:alpha/beta fold hydrolase n=1 Tax=Lentibacillus sp. Marseille-P4043 TaxID=2040293 RepID=UPI001F38E3F2|nr:alpha/beta fold hydrolase [Lentibacillus sp. Marseille-P4043]